MATTATEKFDPSLKLDEMETAAAAVEEQIRELEDEYAQKRRILEGPDRNTPGLLDQLRDLRTRDPEQFEADGTPVGKEAKRLAAAIAEVGDLEPLAQQIEQARLLANKARLVQTLADQLLADGLSPSSVRNTIDPLRAIYRRALQREQVAINPTTNLDLPSSRRGRVRIAAPAEADALLAALPAGDRATWATAFYAGLRRGELRALRWSDVDLGCSEIRVERSWDQVEGPIDPKSEASTRTLPLLAALRDHLDQHKLATGRSGSELVCGRTPSEAFVASTLRSRALRAWEAAGVERIKLHECRHTFASLLIAAGENPKAVQEFMGHSTITMTFDLYGHLFPGSRDEARVRMDAYLEAELSHGTTMGQ